MSKMIIAAEFAYKGPQRKGRGTGLKALREVLKYFQLRAMKNNQLAQNREYELWH